jgi:hypothetical protein
MSEAELDQLERDVQSARLRVSQDLERLQSPATLSDFKEGIRSELSVFRDDLVDKAAAYRDDLVDKAAAYRDDLVDKAAAYRDDLVARATNTVKDRAEGFVAEVKERAAANPLAVLAIGGGLLWRLFHKPPIATLLIGGGIFGLLKTDPRHPAMGADLVPQARDLAIAAKDKALELTSEADDMVAASQTKVVEWVNEASNALARAAVAAEPMKETLEQWGVDAEEAVSEFATLAKSVAEQGSARIRRVAQDPEERDKYLLGAAAVALIAAVGIASRRNIPSEPSAY